MPSIDKRKSQMAPLRPTTVLKPDPVDELEKVALTGIEEVSGCIKLTAAFVSSVLNILRKLISSESCRDLLLEICHLTK